MLGNLLDAKYVAMMLLFVYLRLGRLGEHLCTAFIYYFQSQWYRLHCKAQPYLQCAVISSHYLKAFVLATESQVEARTSMTVHRTMIVCRPAPFILPLDLHIWRNNLVFVDFNSHDVIPGSAINGIYFSVQNLISLYTNPFFTDGDTLVPP